MQYLKFIFMLFILLIGYGCGNENNASPTQISSNDLYVNQEKNITTDNTHFKTITKALSKIKNKNSNTIYIAGGDYTKENGENFPINIPKGIKLLKLNKNNKNINIKGFGTTKNEKKVTIVLQGDNVLNNISISSLNNIGILSLGGKNHLSSIKLSNNKSALGLLNDSNITLQNSLIQNNSHIGIELSDNSNLKLINSKIVDNYIGVYVSDNAIIDSESENSQIKQNKQCDFFTNGNKDINLQGIRWDSDIFSFNIEDDCINGENIINIGTGTINYQPIPNNLLFPNIQNEILIISPEFGESISTTEPIIKYTNTKNSNLIMVAIWKQLPKVSNNQIINPKEIVWYWHTGMKNSPLGRVNYNQGATPIDGDINPLIENLTSPKALEKGRTYYLAIWEWDKEGIKVISSSSIYYFIITP